MFYHSLSPLSPSLLSRPHVSVIVSSEGDDLSVLQCEIKRFGTIVAHAHTQGIATVAFSLDSCGWVGWDVETRARIHAKCPP